MSEQAKQSSGGAIPGLLKGLATTARTLAKPTHTAEYPDAPPHLPPRTRGVIALQEENCTSCMLCARECPDWCIYIDSHKETIPATTPGGRDRQRNVLDRFAIDFSLCMYCGICIEVCPFDALHWSPEFEYSEVDIRDLLHEKDRLAEWMPTVPPPPALDPGSADPAEIAAANRPARGAGTSRLREGGAAPRAREGGAGPRAREGEPRTSPATQGGGADPPRPERRQPRAGSAEPATGVGTQPPARKETEASIAEPEESASAGDGTGEDAT